MSTWLGNPPQIEVFNGAFMGNSSTNGGFPIAMLQMFDYETVAMRCTQYII